MDRKEEHLRLARQQNKKNLVNDFDEIRFYHQNFPKCNVEDVDLSIQMENQVFQLPIFINAMTGGTLRALKINEKLALAAKEFQIPLALGSISAALKDTSLLDTYLIAKKVNPKGFLWVNLSADHSLKNMEKALLLSQGDGLQLHLNLPQEIVMPEGDRHFSNWLENIYQATTQLQIPIMVKETGFGMSQQTIQLLKEAGIKLIDVGGRGGTSFTKIENSRRKKREFQYLDDFGQSTVESLLEAKSLKENLFLSATGGIRQPFDVVKAIALGADVVGLAGALLPLVMEQDVTEFIEELNDWMEELKLLYTLLGVKNTTSLQQVPLLFSEKILSYANQRHINLTPYQVK